MTIQQAITLFALRNPAYQKEAMAEAAAKEAMEADIRALEDEDDDLDDLTIDLPSAYGESSDDAWGAMEGGIEPAFGDGDE